MPLNKFQPDGSHVVRSHCTQCGLQCGILCDHFPGDREIHVLGDADSPVNRGDLCKKGWTATELLDHPHRVRAPRVRTPSGAIQEASWEAALDALAGRFSELRGLHGPGCLSVLGSASLTNEHAYLLGKFARVALNTLHLDYDGRFSQASASWANWLAFGTDRGLPFPLEDIAQAELVVLVGCNVVETVPPLKRYLEALHARGGQLVVVDQRRTESARVADRFISIAPGSEAAFFQGLLFIAIQERLIDRAFIDARTSGFEAARQAAMAYYPVRVERLTGVAEATGRALVRLLAGAGSAMVLTARGSERQSEGLADAATLINLMLALGKVGKPHSGYGFFTLQGNGQGSRDSGIKGERLPGGRLIEDPEARRVVADRWGLNESALVGPGRSAHEIITSLGQPGGTRGLLLAGSDLEAMRASEGGLDRGLASLDCLAVCDAFPHPATDHAHVFLPTTLWAEEHGTVTSMEGRVSLIRPSVHRPPGVRPLSWILAELATRLGVERPFRFTDTAAIFDELAALSAGGPIDYSGLSHRRLDASGGLFWPCPAADHPGSPRLFSERFAHPDGKARFLAPLHLPVHEEPSAEFPLYFTTARYRVHANQGAIAWRAAVDRGGEGHPVLEVHPRLARELDVSDGHLVDVESRHGTARFFLAVQVNVRPDTVVAPFRAAGSGYTNLLGEPVLDEVSRMPNFPICVVRVKKVPAAPGEGVAR